MIKQDEFYLITIVKSNEYKIPYERWDGLTKRHYSLLAKWSRKGYWDYGVSIRSGWATDKGKEYFTQLLETSGLRENEDW